jgi:hypothetical protein
MMIILSSRDSNVIQSLGCKPSVFIGKVLSIGDVVTSHLNERRKKAEIVLQSMTKIAIWILLDEQISFRKAFEEVSFCELIDGWHTKIIN